MKITIGHEAMFDNVIRGLRYPAYLITGIALAEAVLIRLGKTYGSTRREWAMRLPGDQIVSTPRVVTNHAITINAPADCVWPGWCRWAGIAPAGTPPAGWTSCCFLSAGRAPTASSPSCRTSSRRLHPRRCPEAKCGLIVELLEPGRAMALHSTSHLPLTWRDKASLDWSWAFVLFPIDDGAHTRFLP